MLSQTSKDILSGIVAANAQVLVGQPFDIVKVRLQTAPDGTYKGMVDCATRIISKEGPLAFYKGTLTPLLGVGACVSIQFGVMEELKRKFTAYNLRDKTNSSATLTRPQLYTAGAIAGIANSVVAGPVEHIRIRLQAQQTKVYNGPLDCIKKIVSQAGLSGIYRGQVPTLLREGQGMGVYFLTYEALVQQSLKRSGLTRKELPTTHAMLFGASAGVALWLSAYPLDIVKTRMQTDALNPAERQYKGPLDCARQIYRSAGVGGFFRGLTPTLVRAPFANAATFVAFEWAARNLSAW
ncbi:putative YMC1-protein of the mitochondrial carrier family [Tilletiaria anomala UBC 951]|uniref:Putative YMC1-protein of the mitochondrial carrier family n=1 Tax=Tilletiaria anomala (strain ATCC 24038 / CBS 436.72 / UBC 951) TaxID=1037660 RepID=A0A066WL87_TILAU|nr:putative YMC1-protein of the mitochondrial carrier family [Tilletiaria anomala UBC 951]KDN51375.1 putative YMC1-protein of the mitochondrial carrier family [Tilletiaria anomala UBC 951]